MTVFYGTVTDNASMQYLLVAQFFVIAFLLFLSYQQRMAKKKLAVSEKKSKRIAAALLEHDEKWRLKFTNSVKKIIDKNSCSLIAAENAEAKNKIVTDLFHFADECAAYNPNSDTLVTAIEKITKIKSKKNLKICFTTNVQQSVLSLSTEIIIYRAIKEAINNAIAYSHANKIFVSLHYENNIVSALVEDNGIGFDVNKPTTGTGLMAITEAVSILNGKIEIQSHKNKGSLLSLLIPAYS